MKNLKKSNKLLTFLSSFSIPCVPLQRVPPLYLEKGISKSFERGVRVNFDGTFPFFSVAQIFQRKHVIF